MHVRTRLAARVAVVGLSLGAVALPLAATQAHAAGAAVAVSAGTSSTAQGLANGQVITVSGTGFTASAGVSILVCSGSPTAPVPPSPAPPQCDISNVGGAATDGTGAFPATNFTIHAGAIGNGFCPSKVASGQCYLIVSDQASGGANTVLTPIYFAPVVTATPSTNVKNGQTLTVTGYGFAKKKEQAAVLQCAFTASPGASTCDTGNVVLPFTTANGTFTAKLKVRLGKFGTASVKAGGKSLVSATTYLNPSPTPPPPPNSGGAALITFSKTQPVAPTKTSIKATAKAHGKKVTVAGVIKGGSKATAGLKVTIFEKAKGKAWKKAGTAVSKKGGKFSKSLKRFSHKEYYKVTHAKQTLAKKVYAASSSKVLSVKA